MVMSDWREFKRVALRDRYGGADEIGPGDHFRHRMLDLNARVHFDEKNSTALIVVKVFERSGPAVARSFGKPHRRGAQAPAAWRH